MVSVNLRDLLDAGVHFGHQTRRWNPKMKPYIFTQRNGIYIVDLRQTAVAFREALDFLGNLAAEGGTVMFVGTKRQAQEAVRDAAERTGMYFVNQRWLGGLLTNFQTIRKSVARLKDIEAMEEDGRMALMTKKEGIKLRRRQAKLFRNLEGIKEMEKIPDALFVLDVGREHIAVSEAMKLDIPIVAIVDTNCDPDGIDFVVPGNDDALRSIRLFLSAAADAILEGRNLHEKAIEDAALAAVEEAKAAADADAAPKSKAAGGDAAKEEPAKDKSVEQGVAAPGAEAKATTDAKETKGTEEAKGTKPAKGAKGAKEAKVAKVAKVAKAAKSTKEAEAATEADSDAKDADGDEAATESKE